MSSERNIRAYRETDLHTMSREKLIVMLYRKMLDHLEIAAVRAVDDRAEMNRRLGLTQHIVTELRAALDHTIAGEIAANLSALYEYVFHEMLTMQLDRDPIHARNCITVLTPLYEAWLLIPPGAADREQTTVVDRGTDPATEVQPPNAVDALPQQLVSISA